MALKRTDLDCGIRVVTDEIPGVRSIALGAWVGAGSRDEPPELNGATHFLEHLLFKGTESRTARDIAEAFDAVGGDLNAFTTREFTCFHARTLDDDLPMAAEIIADMLRNSVLRHDDVESERRVVLEEISMHEDAPDDIIHDLFVETIWGSHAIARRVQGVGPTIETMPRDAIDGYYRLHYRPGNMVWAAAGSLDHDLVVKAVERAYREVAPDPARPPRGGDSAPAINGVAAVRARDIEQCHLVYGTRGTSRADDRRWAMSVLHTALGSGMSSRLFQEVREQRGLVYAIFSQPVAFAETGLFTIYAGTSPDKVREVLGIVRHQVSDIITNGITEEELVRAKGHLRGGLVLGLEDPSGRMWHLGKSELCHGEILSASEIVERIEAVTLDDVRRVGADVLGTEPWGLAALGPDADLDLSEFSGVLR